MEVKGLILSYAIVITGLLLLIIALNHWPEAPPPPPEPINTLYYRIKSGRTFVVKDLKRNECMHLKVLVEGEPNDVVWTSCYDGRD